jgi:hypothetical protein
MSIRPTERYLINHFPDKLPANARDDYWHPQWKAAPADVERNRNWLDGIIAKNEPIPLISPPANGDALVKISAFARVLSVAYHRPPTSFSFREGRGTDSIDYFIMSSVQSEQGPWSFTDYQHHVIAHFSYALAVALGVSLDHIDLHRTPLLLPAPSGPLANFTTEKDVIRRGEELRQHWHDPRPDAPIVVVASCGSLYEKTVSDTRLQAIAAATKQRHPAALTVGITDKIFRRQKSFTWEFPQDPAYLADLKKDLVPTPGGLDVTPNPTEIMELLSYFYAADFLITPDCYWGWLGHAAQGLRLDNPQPYVIPTNRQITLMPLANPGVWALPLATTITSAVYQKFGNFYGPDCTFPVMLPLRDYYATLHQMHLGPDIDPKQEPHHPQRGMDESVFMELDKVIRLL